MFKAIKSIIKNVLNLYPQWICRREFDSQTFIRFNERPIEFSFVFRKLGEIYPKSILDVGAGTTALPHMMRNCGFLVTSIDNVRDYWPSGMVNRHYHVIDDDITDTCLNGKFDLITCISVLEHVEKVEVAIRNMFSLLNQNGHLIITCPYNEKGYKRNVYELPGSSYGQDAPYITQIFSRTELKRWVQNNHGVIREQELWQFWEGDYWTVGKQIIPPTRVTSSDKHQLICIHIQKG